MTMAGYDFEILKFCKQTFQLKFISNQINKNKNEIKQRELKTWTDEEEETGFGGF